MLIKVCVDSSTLTKRIPSTQPILILIIKDSYDSSKLLLRSHTTRSKILKNEKRFLVNFPILFEIIFIANIPNRYIRIVKIFIRHLLPMSVCYTVVGRSKFLSLL